VTVAKVWRTYYSGSGKTIHTSVICPDRGDIVTFNESGLYENLMDLNRPEKKESKNEM
jgi:hypothetical protein